MRPKRATSSELVLSCQTAEYMKSNDVTAENKEIVTIIDGSTSFGAINNNEE